MSRHKLSGYAVAPPSEGIVVYGKEFFDDPSGDDWMQVWMVPAAGGTPTALTTVTGNGDFDSDPQLSPDETQIAFLRMAGFGTTELYMMDADGSNQTLLTSTNPITEVCWSPTGTSLVFVHNNTDIVTIDPDGSNETVIWSPGASEFPRHPVFNRDGTLIAFQRDKSSGATLDELWVMDADGSNSMMLDTTQTGGAGGILQSWAHATDVIAYTKNVLGIRHVFTINSDGSGSNQLTNTGISPALTREAWSDDDTLIFTPKAQTPWEMYQVPADDSGQSAVSPQLLLKQAVGQGQAWVRQSRIYTVDDNENLVSIAFDGSGFRTEDTALTGPTTFTFFWLSFND